MKLNRIDTDALARRMLLVSLVLAGFAYGVFAEHYGLFPVPWMKSANAAVEAMLEDTGTRLPWYYVPTTRRNRVEIAARAAISPGLTLVSGVGKKDQSLARVIDASGRTIHSWRIDWFEIWPDPKHVPADALPKSNGGLVHGMVLMPNGDLVFNFEELAMVRVDACGKVVWKLPYRTHHSINLDDNGDLWVPGLITREQPMELLPNHVPPFDDYTLLRVSPDGRILEEHSMGDLLLKNGLRGLLHMSSIANRNTKVTGDTLHLNNVEVFPAALPAGVFKAGDVMVSLRNVNAIVVFDRSDWHVKFSSVGAVLRQHDPDFIDGNTISVFDNNNLGVWGDAAFPDAAGNYSRIATISASTGKVTTQYAGTREHPFFTDIMGQHQVLPNGNVLITESIAGRVFEIDRAGKTVWEYFNLIDDGIIGLVADARRLPAAVDEAFFHRIASKCEPTALEH